MRATSSDFFLPWDACTSREQEVTSERKKDTRFTVDEGTGKLKVEAKDPEDKACTTSEVHVLQALQRRSLAMDQANLVEYTLMQQWSDRILRARMDEPPPQYARPSWSQLVSADKKLFSELRDLTRDGVQSSGTGVRPIDKHLPAVMMSYDVVSLLQPMPTAKASGGTQTTPRRSGLDLTVLLLRLSEAEAVGARGEGARAPFVLEFIDGNVYSSM